MEAYKLETTISGDGTIVLPHNFNKLFNHKVEVLVLESEISGKNKKRKRIPIPSYECGGKVRDFTRAELYEPRI
jgi:hypothetical protein